MVDIYNGREYQSGKKIHPHLYGEVLRIISDATSEGFGKAHYSPKDDFKKQIEHGNAVFSAFKVHSQQRAMADRLLDEQGKLKTFAKWKQEALPIASHSNKVWLKTEYNTAVIRSHRAAEFMQFAEQKHILPNIKWLRTTSYTPGEDHSVFWSLPVILPVDHKFWGEHRPGDRWNCKCSWTATDDHATKNTTIDVPAGSMPQQGLEGNPAKTGEIFSQNHPYFPASCGQCPLNRGNLFAGRKNCYQCKKVEQAIEGAGKDIETWETIKTDNGVVRVSSWHGKNERAENVEIATYFANKYGHEIDLIAKSDFKKSADSFNKTLGYEQEYKRNIKPTKGAIDSEIRDASKQANNIVLKIGSVITDENLKRGIKGRVNQANNVERVTVIRNGTDKTYTREQILSSNFNI